MDNLKKFLFECAVMLKYLFKMKSCVICDILNKATNNLDTINKRISSRDLICLALSLVTIIVVWWVIFLFFANLFFGD